MVVVAFIGLGVVEDVVEVARAVVVVVYILKDAFSCLKLVLLLNGQCLSKVKKMYSKVVCACIMYIICLQNQTNT